MMAATGRCLTLRIEFFFCKGIVAKWSLFFFKILSFFLFVTFRNCVFSSDHFKLNETVWLKDCPAIAAVFWFILSLFA